MGWERLQDPESSSDVPIWKSDGDELWASDMSSFDQPCSDSCEGSLQTTGIERGNLGESVGGIVVYVQELRAAAAAKPSLDRLDDHLLDLRFEAHAVRTF